MNNEPKHTPAPWTLGDKGPDALCGMSIEALTPDGKYVEREVCHMMVDSDEETGEPDVEDMANAYLIAAAPELLAACQALEKWFVDAGLETDEDDEECPEITQARAAIAKATGTIKD